MIKLKGLATSVVSLLLLIQSAFVSYGYEMQPRIINGLVADASEFPFYVNLRAKGTDKFCGGTLISDRWIVTAAHCMDERRILIAHLGLDSIGDSYRNFAIELSNQHIHPSNNFVDFDIALIELPGPIESNERVRPVKLTTNCVLPHKEGEHVIVIGRGATESNVTNFSHIWDKRIRYAEFEIMSTGQCMTETEYSYDLTDPMSIICFHSKEGRAAFRGDSGGPLVRAKDGALLGTASMVIYAEEPKIIPSHHIFTSVPFYFDWISKTTGLVLPKCN